MRSWMITRPGILEQTSSEDDILPQDCARVRAARVAVSPSDTAAFTGKSGKYPVVPGRIAMGLVSESNDMTLKIGQRVMLSPYRHTEKGTLVKGVDCDGYFSDFVTCPLSEIYVMPEGVSDESVVFVEDVALAVAVLEKLDIAKTQYLLLNGCSVLNCVIAQLAIYYQAIPVMADRRREMLELAEDMGVYYTVNPDEEDVFEKIKEITSGAMCDCMAADADFFPDASALFPCLKTGGKAAFCGIGGATCSAYAPISDIVSKRLEVYGVNSGDGELETAINMIATEIVKVDGLFGNLEQFSDAPAVLEKAASAQAGMKTIVRF